MAIPEPNEFGPNPVASDAAAADLTGPGEHNTSVHRTTDGSVPADGSQSAPKPEPAPQGVLATGNYTPGPDITGEYVNRSEASTGAGDLYPSPDRIGENVLGYILQEKLGAGAFGTVYRARNQSSGREFALKIAHTGRRVSEEAAKQFKQETEALGALDHPNIVEVFELRNNESKNEWVIISKLIRGKSLQNLLDSEGKDAYAFAEAANLITTVAKAIHYCHINNHIHRDLKPGNILIRDDDRSPVIVDFGLALKNDAKKSEPTGSNHAGTPQYMSPEQAAGNSDQATAQSDVYSMGAILFRLLTGKAPFQEEGKGPLDVLLHAIAESDVQFLKDRSAEDLKNVPVELQNICFKALENNPGNRFATALDMAEALDKFIEAQRAVLEPFWTTNKKVIGSLGGVAAALVAGVSLFAPRYEPNKPVGPDTPLTSPIGDSPKNKLIEQQQRLLIKNQTYDFQQFRKMALADGSTVNLFDLLENIHQKEVNPAADKDVPYEYNEDGTKREVVVRIPLTFNNFIKVYQGYTELNRNSEDPEIIPDISANIYSVSRYLDRIIKKAQEELKTNPNSGVAFGVSDDIWRRGSYNTKVTEALIHLQEQVKKTVDIQEAAIDILKDRLPRADIKGQSGSKER